MSSTTTPALYPWLDSAWQILSTHVRTDRVPQALLIYGAAGLGKATLAERFARKLLCTQPGEFACGVCASCRLFAAGSHPDLKRAVPEEPGKAIKVDTIRKLLGDLTLKSQYQGYRVVIIDPAHMLNISSANALLKTLEEPPDQLVFLLISSQPRDLPATILSRCQKLFIQSPSQTQAEHWLRDVRPDCPAGVLLSAAKGSPLRALALADSDIAERRRTVFEGFLRTCMGKEDPVELAERWYASAHDDTLDWILGWVVDLMRLGAAASKNVTPVLASPDLADPLGKLAARICPDALVCYWDQLLLHRRALAGQANRQLVWEALLIQAAALRLPSN